MAAFDGKVTRNEYHYRLLYRIDSASAVFGAYPDGLKEDGYTVVSSEGGYTVSRDGNELAAGSYDKEILTVNVAPGNEKLTIRPEPRTEKETAGGNPPGTEPDLAFENIPRGTSAEEAAELCGAFLREIRVYYGIF